MQYDVVSFELEAEKYFGVVISTRYHNNTKLCDQFNHAVLLSLDTKPEREDPISVEGGYYLTRHVSAVDTQARKVKPASPPGVSSNVLLALSKAGPSECATSPDMLIHFLYKWLCGEPISRTILYPTWEGWPGNELGKKTSRPYLCFHSPRAIGMPVTSSPETPLRNYPKQYVVDGRLEGKPAWASCIWFRSFTPTADVPRVPSRDPKTQAGQDMVELVQSQLLHQFHVMIGCRRVAPPRRARVPGPFALDPEQFPPLG
jgi:hypothetical protein